MWSGGEGPSMSSMIMDAQLRIQRSLGSSTTMPWRASSLAQQVFGWGFERVPRFRPQAALSIQGLQDTFVQTL